LILPTVAKLVGEAVHGALADLRERAAQSRLADGLPETTVPVLTYAALLSEAAARDPAIHRHLDRVAADSEACDLPERCRRVTLALWERSGKAGPAVVLGLGSMPYLATEIRDGAILRIIRAFLDAAPAQHGVSVAQTPFFAGISDMSFFGEAETGVFARFAAETPVWARAVRLGEGSLAQVPTVNLGPWGRDYHTPWERTHVDYAFQKLPALIEDLTRRLLAV
jgi:arginine utilization protein RocB